MSTDALRVRPPYALAMFAVVPTTDPAPVFGDYEGKGAGEYLKADAAYKEGLAKLIIAYIRSGEGVAGVINRGADRVEIELSEWHQLRAWCEHNTIEVADLDSAMQFAFLGRIVKVLLP